MKGGQVRLMKVFEIENNYQKHRERLMSIQHINTKKKQHVSSIRPSEASIAYKQNRFRADVFAYKTKVDQIQQENSILIQKIQNQHNNPNHIQAKLRSLSRDSSRRSISSSRSSRNIEIENRRIYSKINTVKSNYSKFRNKKSQSMCKMDSKGELLNLLVHQLGVKPSVLFPKVTPNNKSGQNRQSAKTLENRQQKIAKMHLDNIEKARKKYSLKNSGRNQF